MEHRPTTLTHPLLRCVEQIGAALDAVAEVDPVFLDVTGKREALLGLTRLVDRLEGLRMTVVAASDDVAEVEGCRNVASWLAAHTRVTFQAAGRAERLAHCLDADWPVVGAAVRTGRVNLDQARAITASLDDLGADVDPELIRRAEEHLVGEAARFAAPELRRLGARVLEVLDPVTHEDHERRVLERMERRAEAHTRMSIRSRGDGTSEIAGRVPDAAAARLRTVLAAFTSPRHDAMTAAATGSGDSRVDPATGKKLPYERRLGEAFCGLLERLDPNQLPATAGAATKVVVTIDYRHLADGVGAGTLDDGTRISVGEVRRIACSAGIVPAVLGGRSEVLDLGREQRLFSPAQRVALGIGHPTCRAEGCTIPSAWCEAHHHKDPWSRGGRTDLADGLLLCRHHHMRVHDDRYLVKNLPNGDVRFHLRT